MEDLLCDSRQESIVAAFVNAAHARQNDEATEHFERMRPFFLLRPTLSKDGNMWCFQLGSMPESVVGFGDSPDEASREFDKDWYSKISDSKSRRRGEMSLQQCKKCRVTKHIDAFTSMPCPVDGYHEFEFYASPLLNVPKMTPEDLEKIRLENEKHYGPGKGDSVQRRLGDLENRVKVLEESDEDRGLSGKLIG